jgi:CelD/BcsL family acetyltransferase involved in cellulose biosynthesis
VSFTQAQCATEAERAATSPASALLPARGVARRGWESLAESSIEPNTFLDPGFATASASCRAAAAAPRVLAAYADAAGARLSGLLPVVSAWEAVRLPAPALFAGLPYMELSTPLLRADDPAEAVGGLINAAAAAGQRLLVLPQAHVEGRAFAALRAAAAERGLSLTADPSVTRAVFDASQDAEAYLRESLGAKKAKELKRQRRRLEDEGPVAFETAETPGEVAAALERFLALEALGWKGARKTALGQHPGDAAFVRAMAADLAARGRFVVAELRQNGRAVAAGLVLLQGDEAAFFKVAYDETLARWSPGVQLTLDLTRWLAARPDIRLVDSTAAADHPMINHVWRERRTVATAYLPLHADDHAAPALIALIRLRAAARARIKTVYQKMHSAMEQRG